MRAVLRPHPDTPSSTVRRIEAELTREEGRLLIKYWVEGDTAKVRWPAPAMTGRTNGLWRHTCFEVFVGSERGYYEFNFSTSGQWASYRFDDYRHGMALADETAELAILEGRGDYMDLGFLIDIPAAARRLGLSAVIEDVEGVISYWALAHPSDKPDFHHPDSFILDLP